MMTMETERAMVRERKKKWPGKKKASTKGRKKKDLVEGRERAHPQMRCNKKGRKIKGEREKERKKENFNTREREKRRFSRGERENFNRGEK
jgi:hypothetical protein